MESFMSEKVIESYKVWLKNGSVDFRALEPIYRDNSELAEEAFKKNGLYLEDASDRIKNDKDLVLLAIQQNGNALSFISDDLKNNFDFIMSLIDSDFIDYKSFNLIPTKLQNNRKIALNAVQHEGMILEFLSQRFRNDNEIVLAAVKNNGNALDAVSEKLKNNFQIVYAAVKGEPRSIYYASKELFSDIQIATMALEKDGTILRNSPLSVKSNAKLVKIALENNPKSLEFVSEDLKNDFNIAKIALSKKGECLQYISPKLKNNEDLVNLATDNDPYCLVHASTRLKENSKYLIKIVDNNPLRVRGFIEKNNFQKIWSDLEREIKSKDQDFILRALNTIHYNPALKNGSNVLNETHSPIINLLITSLDKNHFKDYHPENDFLKIKYKEEELRRKILSLEMAPEENKIVKQKSKRRIW